MYLTGEHVTPRTSAEAKKLIGEVVQYLCEENIDRSGRGMYFPRYGIVENVERKNIFMSNGNIIYMPDLVEMVKMAPNEEKSNEANHSRRNAEMKVNIFKAEDDLILKNTSSIDNRRNVLGYVLVNEKEEIAKQIVQRFAEHGIKASAGYNPMGLSRYLWVDIDNSSELFKEVSSLNKQSLQGVGIHFLPPTIEFGSKNKASVKDMERDFVWIHQTIHKKALTHFRRFLLENIFDVVDLNNLIPAKKVIE